MSDIDELKIFKFYEHHEIRPQVELMKTEVIKYQTFAGSIKSFEERKDINFNILLLARGRTHSTYQIGGSQTVQH